MKQFNIFIAGWFEARRVMTEIASLLENEGFIVVSRWIQSTKTDLDIEGYSENALDKIAQNDIADLDAANLVILVNPKKHHGRGRGGRHWETGYAYAKGKPIILIGEPENIYHHLKDVVHITMGTPLDIFVSVVRNIRRNYDDRTE